MPFLSTDARRFIDLLASTSGTERANSCLTFLSLISFLCIFLQNVKDILFPKMVFQDHDKKLNRPGDKLELKI